MMNKVKKKKKKKDKKKKKPSMLSFGDEEAEADVFVIKKKKRNTNDQTQELLRSRKRARAKQKLRLEQEKAQKGGRALGPRALGKQESQYANLRSSAGMYTPEQLNALKNNARHSTSDRPRRSNAPAPEVSQSTGSDAPSDGALVKQTDTSSSLRDKHDQKRVQAAREKRSRLRAIGDSYISLNKDREKQGASATIGDREYQLSNNEDHGALVGEDGDDDVEDYIQGHSNRIKFGEGANTRRRNIGSLLSKKKKKSRGKSSRGINDILRNGGLLDAKDEDTMEESDEDDTEMKRWEEAHIRSGGGNLSATSHRDLMYKKPTKVRSRAAAEDTSAPLLQQAPVVISLDDIKKAISSSLEELKADAMKKNRQIEQIRVDIQSANNSMIELDGQLDTLNRKYLFFQSTKDEFASLMDCLKEKSSMIDGAWKELQQLRIKHFKHAQDQRKLHLQDEVHAAWGPPPPSSPKLDDFGRDLNFVSEQGRERRTKEREAKRANKSSEPQGWDADQDEDPSTSTSLQRDYKALVEDSQLIFQDVVEEFSSIEFARDKMQFFKANYSQLYEDAYIGLSGPSVFAPYIRLQLIAWNPLDKPAFDVMPWYNKLFDFGIVEGMEDDDVIPRVVEKLVTPLVVDHYAYIWHPFDPQVTTRAIDIFKETASHLLEDSSAFGLLRTGVVDRLMHEVKAHVKTPIVPTQTPHPSVPASTEAEAQQREQKKLAFCRRQWWRGLKLFSQMARWLTVDADLDKDILDMMNSLLKNSLLPLFAFQVNCICLTGADRSNQALLVSMARMSSRLSAYLPSFSSRLAPSPALNQWNSLLGMLKSYTQMVAGSSSGTTPTLGPQEAIQQGLVLNKMRAKLMSISRT